MTNTKTTKRALFASVLSLLLCISMLVGSTFAWFTDSASTSVNKIQAGNLDIALEMYDEATKSWVNAEGETLDFIKAEGAEDEEILWEPGCTYKLPDLRIVNNGDLHLKYMITITGIDGDAKLNEAIEWTYGAYNEPVDTYVALAPKATSKTITIQGHMKEEAGNEYQGLSIEGISITVFATQLNVENDSFGPDYDKDAPTLVMIGDTKYDTLAAAIAAAQNGDTIELSGTFTLPTDGSLANKELTFAEVKDSIAVIDMKNVGTGQSTGGASLTFKGVEVVFGDQNYKGIQHATKVVYEDCTLYGKQFMYAPTVEFKGCEFINYADYAVWTYGSTAATFTDCTFTTGGKAVLVYGDSGTITANHTFTNCTFNSNGQLATDKAAVEVGDGANATYTITFSNCTANGFAANNSTSPLWGNKNNMPKERLVVTVDSVAQVVDKNDRFANQLTAAALGDVIAVSGDYKLYADLTTKATLVVEEGAEFTLDLNGHTLQNEKNTVNAALITNRGTLTVKNGTLKNDNAGAKTGDEEVMALKNISGTATLNAVKLIGLSSTAGTAEGGVTVLGGTVAMTNCEVTGNRQGLYISGTGAVEMTGGKVTLAAKAGFYAIANNSSGASKFNSVAFVTNSTKSSAAIVYNAFSAKGGSVSFTDCSFESVNKQISIAKDMTSITVAGNSTFAKVTDPNA